MLSEIAPEFGRVHPKERRRWRLTVTVESNSRTIAKGLDDWTRAACAERRTRLARLRATRADRDHDREERNVDESVALGRPPVRHAPTVLERHEPVPLSLCRSTASLRSRHDLHHDEASGRGSQKEGAEAQGREEDLDRALGRQTRDRLVRRTVCVPPMRRSHAKEKEPYSERDGCSGVTRSPRTARGGNPAARGAQEGAESSPPRLRTHGHRLRSSLLLPLGSQIFIELHE